MLDRYDENLILGYVEDELSPSEQASFEQLLADDVQLRTLVQHLIDDRAQLRDVPAVEAPVAILSDVTASLERDMLLGKQASGGPYKFPVWARWASSVAAMLLLAAALTLQFDPFGWRGTDNGAGTGVGDGPIAMTDPGKSTFATGQNDKLNNANNLNGLNGTDANQSDTIARAVQAEADRILQAAQDAQLENQYRQAVAANYVSIELAAADVQATRDELKALAEANDGVFLAAGESLAMRSLEEPTRPLNEAGDRTKSMRKADAVATPFPQVRPDAGPGDSTADASADPVADAAGSEASSGAAPAPVAPAAKATPSVSNPKPTPAPEATVNSKDRVQPEAKSQPKKAGETKVGDTQAGDTQARENKAGEKSAGNAAAGAGKKEDVPKDSHADQDTNPEVKAKDDTVVASNHASSNDKRGKQKKSDKTLPARPTHADGKANSRPGAPAPQETLSKELEEADDAKGANEATRPNIMRRGSDDRSRGNALSGRDSAGPRADFAVGSHDPNAMSFAVPADRVNELIAQLEKKFGRDQIIVQSVGQSFGARKYVGEGQAESKGGVSATGHPQASPLADAVANANDRSGKPKTVSPTRPSVSNDHPDPNADRKNAGDNFKDEGTSDSKAVVGSQDSASESTNENAKLAEQNAQANVSKTKNDNAAKRTVNSAPRPRGAKAENFAGDLKQAAGDLPDASKPAPTPAPLGAEVQRNALSVEKSASKRRVIISIILKPTKPTKAAPAQGTNSNSNSDSKIDNENDGKPASPAPDTSK